MAEIKDKVQASTSAKEVSRADYGRALTWFFSDPKLGSTLLKGSLYLLSCIFILPMFYVGPLMLGYTLDIIRNLQNDTWELPELGAEGQWQKGFMYTIVQFVLAFAIMAIIIAGVFALGAMGQNASEESFAIIGFIGVMLYILFLLFISALSYFQLVIFAKTNEVSSMFSVDNLGYMIKKNILPVIISLVLVSIISNIYVSIGMIACVVGVLPAIMIVYMTMASLFGQFDVNEIE